MRVRNLYYSLQPKVDKMNHAFLLQLQWTPSSPTSLTFLSLSNSKIPKFPKLVTKSSISETLDSSPNESPSPSNLPARERRKLRNERREQNTFNWKEEVELRLIKKTKKRYASWTEELNLDYLARLGPQWWVVRVSRVSSQETAERLAKALANNFPHLDFKVYLPAVQEKRKLKNGTISVKSKPLFPGCVFLKCVLNKEVHDFIRECEGIGGFIGSRVGNTKRQINKPRPVSEQDMEAIFRQAKEEQEKTDKAFIDEHKAAFDTELQTDDSQVVDLETHINTKQTRKPPEPTPKARKRKYPKTGSSVKVVSGDFSEFTGILKKLDRKNGKATVGFALLGKETIAEVDIHDIVETTE